MNKEKVTVILPTFRRPGYLKRALLSVLAQTYEDYTVLILDNASGDDTETVAQDFARWDSRFRYIRNSTNLGGVENAARGFNSVDTAYFCYLADDDLWFPDFLETAVGEMEKHAEAGFFGAVSVCVDENGSPFLFSGAGCPDGCYPPPEGACILWETGWPQQAAVLYRSDVRKIVGGIAPIAGFDLDYLTRIASRLPVIFSSKPLAFFTVGRHSVSASRTVEHVTSEWSFIRKRIEESDCLTGNSKERILESWNKRLPYQIRMMAMLSLSRQNVQDASLGARLLVEQPRFIWTTPIIMASSYFAGVNGVFSSAISIFFSLRSRVFTSFRRLLFYFKYRYRSPIYWWSRFILERESK